MTRVSIRGYIAPGLPHITILVHQVNYLSVQKLGCLQRSVGGHRKQQTSIFDGSPREQSKHDNQLKCAYTVPNKLVELVL